MSFVKEKIPAEDRGLFDSFGLKDPFTGEPMQSRWWTIDRDRKAYLVGLGGQGHYSSDIPRFLALIWKDNIIQLETFGMVQGDSDNGYEKRWKVTSILAPGSLLTESQEVLTLVQEALIAESRDGDEGMKVTFELISTPRFVQGADK